MSPDSQTSVNMSPRHRRRPTSTHVMRRGQGSLRSMSTRRTALQKQQLTIKQIVAGLNVQQTSRLTRLLGVARIEESSHNHFNIFKFIFWEYPFEKIPQSQNSVIIYQNSINKTNTVNVKYSVFSETSNLYLLSKTVSVVPSGQGQGRGRARQLTASMAEWLRAWDTLAMMKLWRREVVSSIPDRGTIVG